MQVLSLFDGMSCWFLALKKAWVKIDKYFSSEIDKFAIQISKKNNPEIIQIWNILDWKKWDLWNIDLIIWWSPCQWFSNNGKKLNFEDKRSKLFFEFVEILKYYKPKYFLLENVKMKKEWEEKITENLFWIEPVLINSNLVSAQNRKRLYWIWKLNENWKYEKVNISSLEDKNIFLKDILEKWKVDEKYYFSDKQFIKIRNSKYKKENEVNFNNQKNVKLKDFTKFSQDNIFCGLNDKVPTLTAWDWWNRPKVFKRKLMPIECERLQNLPDNYTFWVSDRQRYKMIWNWWTIWVIEHIFKNIFNLI